MIKKTLILTLLGLLSLVEGSSIRIMTFNIRRDGKESSFARKWPQRKKHVVDFIKHENPDIFGLQEATEGQLEEIARNFPAYRGVGKGRGSAWLWMSQNEFNPIFFNKHKFRLLKHGTFSINKGGWFLDMVFTGEPKNTGYLYRICTWVLLQDIQTGKLLYVYNTHLDNHFEKARLNGIKKIGKYMRKQERKLPGITTLVMGDFNTAIEGKFAQQLHRIDSRLLDTRTGAQLIEGPEQTANHWGEKPATAIDHILIKNLGAGKVLRNKTCDTAPSYISDHWAVLVDFEIV